jgi:hypothetical protein
MAAMTARATLGSAAAGLGATLVMESVSSWLYEREDPEARSREEQLRSEMPTAVLVRKAARAAGREPADARVERLGVAAHYAFGAAGGLIARLVAGRAIAPLTAGLAVAGGMSVLVDEGLNAALGLTPPPAAFPWQAHARGAAAHAVYGVALGLMLSAAADN